jgi:hypothetical protein
LTDCTCCGRSTVDRDPTKTAVREARRRKLLGSHPVCVRCCEDRPEAFQWHHTGGREHDPDRESLRCRNCHAVVSEGQRRADVDLTPQANPLDREIARLRAVAVDLRDAGDAEDRAAARLEKYRASLDAKPPERREHSEKRK